MVRTSLAIATVLFVLSVPWASAQQTYEQPRPPVYGSTPGTTTQPAAQPAMARGLEPVLINMLIEGNRAEIALSQFGLQRTQNPQVQQFAQQMVREHTDLVNQLQRFQTAGQPASDRAGQLASVLQQAHQRHLALVQQNLAQHQGAKFDAAFMGEQISAHIGMEAKLEAFQQHLSPQVQPALQAALKHTRHHLSLAQNLEQQIAARIAQQPGAVRR
jgi:predicted outer membrane protein